jgi:hypothetical protein
MDDWGVPLEVSSTGSYLIKVLTEKCPASPYLARLSRKGGIEGET